MLNPPKKAVNSDNFKLGPNNSNLSPNCEKLLSSCCHAITKAIHNTYINISKNIKSQSNIIDVYKAVSEVSESVSQ